MIDNEEDKKNDLEKQIEILKKQKREKIKTMLLLLAELTQAGGAVWKEVESLEEKRFIYTRNATGFVFKVNEDEDHRNIFEIQVIDLENKKKPLGVDNICYNDELLYEPAERLYLEIDHGRLQDDEKNMDDVLKELK